MAELVNRWKKLHGAFLSALKKVKLPDDDSDIGKMLVYYTRDKQRVKLLVPTLVKLERAQTEEKEEYWKERLLKYLTRYQKSLKKGMRAAAENDQDVYFETTRKFLIKVKKFLTIYLPKFLDRDRF